MTLLSFTMVLALPSFFFNRFLGGEFKSNILPGLFSSYIDFLPDYFSWVLPDYFLPEFMSLELLGLGLTTSLS